MNKNTIERLKLQYETNPTEQNEYDYLHARYGRAVEFYQGIDQDSKQAKEYLPKIEAIIKRLGELSEVLHKKEQMEVVKWVTLKK